MTISRELTKKVTFCILPPGAKVLYFRLAVAAMENGKLSREEYRLALKPLRGIYLTDEDYQELLENGYMRYCEDGSVQLAYDEKQRNELKTLYRQEQAAAEKENNVQE